MYFDTINDLKIAFPSTTIGPPNGEYIVAGYFAPGDGGGGTFVWVPTTSPLADDGGIVIRTPSGSYGYTHGYFKRLYSGPINVRWFGAKGDGSTDDTTAVHAARDSSFAREGGTLYFPKGVYLGAFVVSHVEGEVNLIGDGDGSVLLASGNTTVLRLGYHNPFWRYSKVSNLTIDGQSKNADGVTFDDSISPEFSGRWNFENVTIRNCKKGIYKPKGNIGNTYTNCLIAGNDYGYYAVDFINMHAGCEIFKGGHIEGSSHAAIYVNANYFYGQVIIDGTIIEGNQGFGIYLKLKNTGQMMFTPMEIRNVWVEGNAIPQFSCTLDINNMVPPVSPASGAAGVATYFNPSTNNLVLGFNFDFTLTGNHITGGGIYSGAAGTNGTLITALTGFPGGSMGNWGQTVTLTSTQITDLFSGNIYVVIATNLHTGGELRGQLQPAANIVIDGITYTPQDIRTFYFEGVRSLCFSSTQVIDIALVNSSVNFINCRSDNHFMFTNEWPYRVEVDEGSQIIANELLYGGAVSESIFVNSIAYDGSSDVYNSVSLPTSVWGPLRTTLMAGLENVLLWSGPTEIGSELWPGFSGSHDQMASIVADSGTAINTIYPSSPAQVNIACRELTLSSGQIVSSQFPFTPPQGEYYYFWSIHAKVCNDFFEHGSVKGWIGGEPNSNVVLGQVIFKGQDWACAYGIKKYNPIDVNPDFNLWFEGVNGGVRFRFCHWQVLIFSRLDAAVAYMNSKGVAYPGYGCEVEPVPE